MLESTTPAILIWMALGIALAAIALRSQVRDRRRLRAALVFIVLFTTVRFLRMLPVSWTDPRLIDDFSVAILQLASVQIARVLVFDLILRRVRVPRWAVEAFVIAAYLGIIGSALYKSGVNVTGIFATSAVATAVIGLALQETLVNVAAGISIQFEGSFQNDQFLRYGDIAGWIQHVRLRYTELKTLDGATIIIPNSLLTRSQVTVIGDSYRRSIPLLMPHSFDPQSVIAAVESALCASPVEGVAPQPAPECLVDEMGPGHIKYAVRVWLTKPGQHTSAMSAVNVRIYYALKRLGMPVGDIPQTVELVAPRPAPATMDHKALLRGAHFLRHIGDAELSSLGDHLSHLSYGPGECILRQGDPGDSMYFVVDGTVAIMFKSPDGAETEVKAMGPGDFFGERSLMTGEARTASAVARTRVECCMLNKAGIEDLMHRQPQLAEDVSVVMAHRQMELAGLREKLDLETARQRERESQIQLLKRIQRSFADENA